jgi:hypothetical protein
MRPRLLAQWLLALADPRGPSAALPARPLGAEAGLLPALADWHGVLPAVAANLRDAATRARAGVAEVVGPDGPAPFFKEAQELLARRVALTMLCRRQAAEITAATARAGLPAFVLKGADFADRLYPDPDLRPFTDTDILTRRSAVDAVRGLLRGLGYEPVSPPLRKYAVGYGEETWHRPGSPGGAVEVHWDLVNSPAMRQRVSVGYDDLELEPGPGGAGRPTVVSLLAIAAVHGATGHRFDRAQILCDVCQAARAVSRLPGAAWLSDFSGRTGSGLAVGSALLLAADALGDPSCADLLGRLTGARTSWMARVLIGPAEVVWSRRLLPRLRRQVFRELLKRL